MEVLLRAERARAGQIINRQCFAKPSLETLYTLDSSMEVLSHGLEVELKAQLKLIQTAVMLYVQDHPLHLV